jgi:hypothetical protein
MKFKILFVFYFFVVVSLFLYSFTQVDLSLTLSRASIWQDIQKSFQYLGFFQRPLSAMLFSAILFLLFLFYGIFLFLTHKNLLTKKQSWILVIGTTVILALSYNAFSYDLFNYIFDAKILTHYAQNPFLHKPSDFANDPMLNFMRWTHRLYPYGPSWLMLTVPLSFIGMNYFLPTLIMYKLLNAGFFLGLCYLIFKTSEKIFPKNAVFNLVFFALNPLVIIESLVSSHNEIPMMFFTILAIYLFINKRNTWSVLSYLFSVGIKYATLVLFPVYLALFYFKKIKKEIPWEKIFLAGIVLSLVSVVIASVRTTFQPWYLLYFLPFAALIAKKNYVFIPTVLLSLLAASIYIPYVLLSDYDKGYPAVVLNIEVAGLVITGLTTIICIIWKNFQK